MRSEVRQLRFCSYTWYGTRFKILRRSVPIFIDLALLGELDLKANSITERAFVTRLPDLNGSDACSYGHFTDFSRHTIWARWMYNSRSSKQRLQDAALSSPNVLRKLSDLA